MEKNVVISIKGKQQYVNMDSDTIELVTEGRLQKNAAGYAVIYQETELTGLEGTTTIIQVCGDQVTMMRAGEVNTQMVFCLGQRHFSVYHTPYGDISVTVNARHVMVDLDDQGGDVELDYDIEVDHTLAGRNVFQIHVEESKSNSLKQ